MSAADDVELDEIQLCVPEATEGTNVKLLWHIGYWDGPLDGVCEYEGRRHAFRVLEDTRNYRWRIAIVTELSPDQLAALEEQHARFQQYVGTHTDYNYDAEGKRSVNHDGLKPESEWKKFYNQPAPAVKSQPSQPPSNRTVAWFRL